MTKSDVALVADVTTETIGPDRPLANFVKFEADGAPYLQGFRCAHCGEVLLGEHRACPSCASRGSLRPIRLSGRGRLYAYTIVHRSFPGVKTPLISAAVWLDEGAFAKANLVGVEPRPEAIAFDMPVHVEFQYLKPKDGQGGRLVLPVFVADASATQGAAP